MYLGIGCALDWTGFESWQSQEIFLVFKMSRGALEPTESPVQWLPVQVGTGTGARYWTFPSLQWRVQEYVELCFCSYYTPSCRRQGQFYFKWTYDIFGMIQNFHKSGRKILSAPKLANKFSQNNTTLHVLEGDDFKFMPEYYIFWPTLL